MAKKKTETTVESKFLRDNNAAIGSSKYVGEHFDELWSELGLELDNLSHTRFSSKKQKNIVDKLVAIKCLIDFENMTAAKLGLQPDLQDSLFPLYAMPSYSVSHDSDGSEQCFDGNYFMNKKKSS